MSLDVIKFAFIAGEVSPNFFGRSDLESFDMGLAEATNWFVDYRGGLSTRPGTIFDEFIMLDDKPVRMFQFKFAPTVANTYLLLFGDLYIRFLQQGSYVLEAAKTVSAITKANPGVVTSNAHGFVNGDWVKFSAMSGMTQLQGRTAIVAGATANTFQLHDHTGAVIDTTSYGVFTAGQVARVYTLVSPYAADDLEELTLFQRQDLVRMTHASYAPRDLTRTSATSWAITFTSFGSTIDAPTNLVLSSSNIEDNAVAFATTAINDEGEESIASQVAIKRNVNNYSTVSGSVFAEWDPTPDAVSYRIYRSVITDIDNNHMNRGVQLGYLGTSKAPSFVDNNIIPDFTRTPPVHYNPFAVSAITAIEVTNGGAGYTDSSVITIAGGGGSGFKGFPVIDLSTGKLISVVIQDGGHDYVGPVATITVGAGATVTITVGPAVDTWPALNCIFQQRQIYSASGNKPLTAWGSRPGQFNNFDVSDVTTEADSYEFDLDTDEVTPIKHIIPMRGGLLILSDGGVYQLTGGGLGDAVTATNVLVDPHSFTGVSDVVPIKIDTDLLYVENKGYTVRLLSYNDFSRIYSGQDVSILSNHLFTTTNYLTRWSYASDPYKMAWGRRLDGALLGFTIVKEQKVFAWTKHFTKGQFMDVLAVQEDRTDVVYFVVKRLINGRYVQYVEHFAPRQFGNVEDAHCVDAGLALGATYPAAGVNVSANTGSVTVTADAAVFSAGDVGKVWRGGGGKGLVTAYTDTTHITVSLANDITATIPQDAANTVYPMLQGEWTLDAKITSISGLWHLEGQTVSVLADGSVQSQKTVTAGALTLDVAASRVVIGLPFTATAKTLPMTIQQATIEGRRKRVMGLAARLNEARGLKYGGRLSKLYQFRERTTELYGEPTALLSEMKSGLMQSQFTNDAQIYVVQDQPLPATLLGFVLSTEIGDDTE